MMPETIDAPSTIAIAPPARRRPAMSVAASRFAILATYHWLALSVRPQWEKKVADDLQKRGFEAFLPLRRTRRQWSDRMKWVDSPLFSGYLFVRVSQREYFSALEHPAALRFVTFAGVPAVVQEEQVLNIKRALGEGVDLEATSKTFKPGQAVQVTAGPMIGLCGQVVRFAGRRSLLIRLGQTGLNMVVNLQAGCVEAV